MRAQSCLALKIIYNEQDTDFVFTVSPGKLYAKCKKQKIPFHLWYNWIEKELQKVDKKLATGKLQHLDPATEALSRACHDLGG